MPGLHPNFAITNAITATLTRIERARGFLEAATLSADWIQAMGKRALVLGAHHTTHIEGTRLTLDQAQRLLAGEAVPEADPDSGAPISEGLIRVIHEGSPRNWARSPKVANASYGGTLWPGSMG